jgi:hypothetical protein
MAAEVISAVRRVISKRLALTTFSFSERIEVTQA